MAQRGRQNGTIATPAMVAGGVAVLREWLGCGRSDEATPDDVAAAVVEAILCASLASHARISFAEQSPVSLSLEFQRDQSRPVCASC